MSNKTTTIFIALANFCLAIILFLFIMSSFNLWEEAPGWSNIFKIKLPESVNNVNPLNKYLNRVPEGSLKDALNTRVSDICLSPRERELANLINNYRRSNNLNTLPVTKSLTYVARVHINDLIINKPYLGDCNQHSWSKSSLWIGYCVADGQGNPLGHAKARELKTGYAGDIYEIVNSVWRGADEYTRQAELNYEVDEHLSAWQQSYGHNIMIINKDEWSKLRWEVMGVAVINNYAIVWFGRDPDPNGIATVCQ